MSPEIIALTLANYLITSIAAGTLNEMGKKIYEKVVSKAKATFSEKETFSPEIVPQLVADLRESFVADPDEQKWMEAHLPKVFISYCNGDPDADAAWIEHFAKDLQDQGILVTLDAWSLAFGDPLPFFMETAVRDNEFVLLICTESYKEKVDKRLGGAGYEANAMTAELFEKRNHRKFIPVLRGKEAWSSLPTFRQGAYYVDMRDDSSHEDNLNRLVKNLKGN